MEERSWDEVLKKRILQGTVFLGFLSVFGWFFVGFCWFSSSKFLKVFYLHLSSKDLFSLAIQARACAPSRKESEHLRGPTQKRTGDVFSNGLFIPQFS